MNSETINVSTRCNSIKLNLAQKDGKLNRVRIEYSVIGCTHSNLKAVESLINLCLDKNIDAEDIVKHLSNHRCRKHDLECLSCSDMVAREIRIYVKKMGEVK